MFKDATFHAGGPDTTAGWIQSTNMNSAQSLAGFYSMCVYEQMSRGCYCACVCELDCVIAVYIHQHTKRTHSRSISFVLNVVYAPACKSIYTMDSVTKIQTIGNLCYLSMGQLHTTIKIDRQQRCTVCFLCRFIDIISAVSENDDKENFHISEENVEAIIREVKTSATTTTTKTLPSQKGEEKHPKIIHPCNNFTNNLFRNLCPLGIMWTVFYLIDFASINERNR